MVKFERVTLWLAAVLGSLFACGSFYISLAQPFKWWPFAEIRSAPVRGAESVGPALVPAWVLLSFGVLGGALLLTILSYRFLPGKREAHTTVAQQQFNLAMRTFVRSKLQNVVNTYWAVLREIINRYEGEHRQASRYDRGPMESAPDFSS